MEKIAAILVMVKRALMDNGFIRVDGLRSQFMGSEPRIIAKADPCKEVPVIKYNSNNSMMAVVLPDRTVWSRATGDGRATEVMLKVGEVAMGILVEQGCFFVPLSNQENVSYYDLFRRLADPNWVPDYHMTQEAIDAGFSPN